MKILLNLGLVFIPFLIIPGLDLREPKMNLALGIALALGLTAIFSGKLKKFTNIPLLLLIGLSLLSIYLSPKPSIELLGKAVSNFWVWKPMFYILTFSLMLVTVSSLDFSKKDIKLIFQVMSWVGFLMSVYVIFQFLGLDQFLRLSDNEGTRYVTQKYLGGSIGQPTLVSPFIAMIIPIALYLNKWFKTMALVMIIAVILTLSQIAIGAMVISLLFLFSTAGKVQFSLSVLTFLMLGAILILGYFYVPRIKNFVQDKGRFETYELIISDLKNPMNEKSKRRQSLTGFAPGTYEYNFPLKHNSRMQQAHNDYLETAYNTGYIGLILLLSAIFYVFYKSYSLKKTLQGKPDKYKMVLLASFVAILVSALGTFVFQLAATLFYTLIIVGLLSNKGGEKCVRQC